LCEAAQAASKPIIAQSVIAAAVLTDGSESPSSGKGANAAVPSRSKITPIRMATTINGVSLRSVVTTWNEPAERTPSRFTPVIVQITASAVSDGCSPSTGRKLDI